MRREWIEKRVERIEDEIPGPEARVTKQNRAAWQMELVGCLRISGEQVCRCPRALAVFNRYGRLIEYYRHVWEDVGDAETGPMVEEGFARVPPEQWTRKIRRLHLPKARR